MEKEYKKLIRCPVCLYNKFQWDEWRHHTNLKCRHCNYWFTLVHNKIIPEFLDKRIWFNHFSLDLQDENGDIISYEL